MKRNLIVIAMLSTVLLTACKAQSNSYSEEIVGVQSQLSVSDKLELKKKLEEESAVFPVEVYNDSLVASGSNAEFDTLDSNDKLLHVHIDDSGWRVERDVPEETVAEIEKLVKHMSGSDVDCKVADTYSDYVEVTVQGTTYTYKDGVLELRE